MTNRLNVSIFSFSVNNVASPRIGVHHIGCVGLSSSDLTAERAGENDIYPFFKDKETYHMPQ
jgi:hypothetical protein